MSGSRTKSSSMSSRPRALGPPTGVLPTEGPESVATGTIAVSVAIRTSGARPSAAGTRPRSGEPQADNATDLSSLAAGINDAYRGGEAAALDALGHIRRAGELLIRVKAWVGHGKFRRWVQDHCEFGDRSAVNSMTICRRWPEVEEMLGPDPHRVADLTLAGVLRRLSGPRTRPGPGRDSSARRTIGPAEAESPTGRRPAGAHVVRPAMAASRVGLVPRASRPSRIGAPATRRRSSRTPTAMTRPGVRPGEDPRPRPSWATGVIGEVPGRRRAGPPTPARPSRPPAPPPPGS
jgi:hypothetical protein